MNKCAKAQTTKLELRSHALLIGSMTAALLAGCGGGQPMDSTPRTALPAQRSWMLPEAKKSTSLLYVSNWYSASVTVYTYLDGGGLIQVGTLTGFNRPAGMCTDKAGDVWITDNGSNRLYEYAHAGTTPIETLRESGNTRPNDCAVDPSTGDLAVANQFPNAHYYETGNVKIYHPHSHTAIKYSMGYMHVEFLAYDDHSNLYVDGPPTSPYGYGNNGPLVVIPSGSKEIVDLTLQGATLYDPGAVQWINPTLLVGDNREKSSFAYKFFVSGTTATVVGKIQFPQTPQAAGFWRRADKVIVPDPLGNAVRVYELSDGTLDATLTDGLSYPYGAVVSQP